MGNSAKETKTIGNLYNEMRNLRYKLVYLTPEKMVKSPGLINTLDELY